MQNNNRKPPEQDPGSESIRERLHGWRLGFSLDGEKIAKGLLCALLLIIFALTQTTLFTRFRPFGVVPDLILPLTVAVAMVLREKWGAVFGLVSAFVIESLGGSSLTLLPILYMLTGYTVGLCAVYYFRDSIAVRILYTLISSAARAVFTLITLAATVGDLNLVYAFVSVIIPEFISNLIFAVLPHTAAKLLLRPISRETKE